MFVLLRPAALFVVERPDVVLPRNMQIMQISRYIEDGVLTENWPILR